MRSELYHSFRIYLITSRFLPAFQILDFICSFYRLSICEKHGKHDMTNKKHESSYKKHEYNLPSILETVRKLE